MATAVAVLGSSRSATCRAGAGKRDNSSVSAGFEPQRHLQEWCMRAWQQQWQFWVRAAAPPGVAGVAGVVQASVAWKAELGSSRSTTEDSVSIANAAATSRGSSSLDPVVTASDFDAVVGAGLARACARGEESRPHLLGRTRGCGGGYVDIPAAVTSESERLNVTA